MPLSELLPAVEQLSHQDKLRLIHFLLLAVAKEVGCELGAVTSTPQKKGGELESTADTTAENLLLKQLASTEAVVWSPYEAHEAAHKLSELLEVARQQGNA